MLNIKQKKKKRKKEGKKEKATCESSGELTIDLSSGRASSA